MKASKKIISITLLSVAMAGCASSFIDVREGSDKVHVATADAVAHCDSKGTVTSTVLSKVLFVSRSVESMEENLLQMAKNAAIDAGANTVVRGESKKVGERSYDLYHCK